MAVLVIYLRQCWICYFGHSAHHVEINKSSLLSFLSCKHRKKYAEKPLLTPRINTKLCSRGGHAMQQASVFSFTLLKYFCWLLCTAVSVVQTFITLIYFPNWLLGRKYCVLQLLKFFGGPQKGYNHLRASAAWDS